MLGIVCGARRASVGIGVLVCALVATTGVPASGSSVTVPTDAPTIQEALNARPDTVLVRAGRYRETPVVSYPTVLIGISGEPDLTRPTIDGLWFVPAGLSEVLQFTTRNLESLGEVHIRNDQPSFFDFSACRFGAGFFEWSRYLETRGLRFEGCELEGEVWVAADGYCVLDSCVIRGNVIVGDQMCDLTVRRCLFQGSGAGWGIAQRTSEIRSATIDSCIIENFRNGILVDAETSVIVRNTVVRDCAGPGMVVRAGGVVHILDNRVERCGGDGITTVSTSPTLLLLRNRVSECGAGGQAYAGINVYVEDSAVIAENVVWANATNGIAVFVRYSLGSVEVRNNTSVGNKLAGIVSLDGVDTLYYQGHKHVVTNNIAAYNGTHGIHWYYPFATTTGCNDWFGNALSDVSGREASPSDVSLDPGFCGRLGGDLRLNGGSQLLELSGCGLIGALGAGCDTFATPVRVTRFTAERSGAAVRLAWAISGGLEAEDLWVERSEQVTGLWTRSDGQRTLRAGVVSQVDESARSDRAYWYRLVGMVGGVAAVIAEPIWVGKVVVQAFRLESVGPNPGRGTIEIKFALPVPGDVALEIFDIQGRSVSSLVRGVWPAGEHIVKWGGPDGAGVYIVRYRYPGGQQSKRLIHTG